MNEVVFSDESRFNLSSDDNQFRVWRSRGECLNSAFALQRHTTTTAGVMVWRVIAYSTRSPLVLIRSTMTVCNHMCCHSCNGSQEPFFQLDNARPNTAKVSQDYFRTVTILPWPARSPDLSPIEHNWDHLRRRFRHPMSLSELEARLQQIGNEMSQDIIQNLYASIPDRIASSIRVRGNSTGN
ncbi:transposable element Tcb2 transposase [Trichonephila clavipes]|nr:transposable element Tcb2 transposase [Trichonephila clavipes]